MLLDNVVTHGHHIVHPYAPNVDRAFMRAATERGLVVNAWTVRDDEASLTALIALGVDGVICGAPDVLLQVLANHPLP